MSKNIYLFKGVFQASCIMFLGVATATTLVTAALTMASDPAQLPSGPNASGRPDSTRANHDSTIATESIAQNFMDLRSIRFHANVRIRFHQEADGLDVPLGVTIGGDFEYHADGIAWRKSSYLDDTLIPWMNTEVAYNGDLYQYFAKESGILGMSTLQGDDNVTGITLPNPLLELGFMLVPEHDLDRELTLSMIRDAAYQWGEAHAMNKMLRSPDSAPRPSLMSASPIDGMASSLHIMPSEANGMEVASISRFVDSGADPASPQQVLAARVVFSEYQPFVGGDGVEQRWPTQIVYEGIDLSSGNVAVTMEFNIDMLEINTADLTPASEFLIDPARAKSVWIKEAEQFATQPEDIDAK